MRILLFFSLLSFVFTAYAGDKAEAARTNAKLGLAYLAKGYYPQSKDRLISALRDDPHIAAGWYSMAYYLEKTGDTKAAETYYKKALAVEPDSGPAKNNYGTYLCRMSRYEEALKYFESAAKEPAYLDAASAYENAGTCALMMKDGVLASKYFHRAIDNNPNMPFALLSLARLSHQSGDDQNANQYFADFKRIALHNKPENIVEQYEQYVFSSKAVNTTRLTNPK